MTQQLIIKLLADGLILPIVLLAIYALVWKIPKARRYESYCRIVMAGLTAFLIAKLLATLYQPMGERPFELLGASAGASYLNNPGFPSDHALFTAAITFAVWAETRSRWITIALATMTILLSIGRVLALVHTPLDVVGGIVVAAVGAGWYLTARPSITRKVTSKHI